jgi:tetratricopeptide (TPR) repeat protein
MQIGKLFQLCNSTDLAYQSYQKAFNIYESTTMCIDANSFQRCLEKLIDAYFDKNDERSVLNLLERALKKYKQFSDDRLIEIKYLQYMADKYKENDDIKNALHYLEKALKHAEITKSHDAIRPLLQEFIEFYKEEGQEQIIETYIQRAIDVCEEDPLELSKCHWLLYDWCKTNDMKDKALKYYEYFLLTTERNHSSSREILDKIWIDFTLSDSSGYFRSDRLGGSMKLESLMQVCYQRLPSLHFKKAIILWKGGALHEIFGMTTAAFYFYSIATEIFEKLIYNQNDIRTKQALNYLLSEKYECDEYI